jgi:hypothetical protein
MRFNLPIFRRLSDAFRNRDWFGVGFELFVVVLGVALGLEASRWAAAREEREYRRQIIASLDRTFADYEDGCRRIHDHITTSLDEFARRTAKGERPIPPTLSLPAMERPPTRAWEALVATGAAEALDPDLLFRLSLHFDRADSFGDKYQRYNLITEQQIAAHRGDPKHFYGLDGKLKPMFAAHVDQLRDLLTFNDQMGRGAAEIRKELELPKSRLTQDRGVQLRP